MASRLKVVPHGMNLDDIGEGAEGFDRAASDGAGQAITFFSPRRRRGHTSIPLDEIEGDECYDRLGTDGVQILAHYRQ